MHPAGFIGSIIGAIIVLALFGLVSRRRLVA
ncbi:MAG: GlsB/YeaQ/YmgE family stress response membrane protein [Myxococcales bacterium]|nr:GlsB/YeaQ/YmgE family stress response membrane protein [Myxococcales bacterium]